MTDFKWYNDAAAKRAHALVEKELQTMIVSLFPEYELSHMGINRNTDTEEVQIRLHLNKLGRVRVVPTPAQEEALQRLADNAQALGLGY